MPDEQLVRESVEGRAGSFDTLVKRYLGLVYALGLARLRDRDVVEDLVQEVFLRIYLNLGSLREPKYFGTWVSRVARNLATDWARRGQRASRLLPMVQLEDMQVEIADQKKGARQVSESKEEEQLVRDALAQLPVDQREVVLLHYAEDMNYEEIAQKLGVHPTTVGRTLKKALGSMKRDLQPAFAASVRDLRIPQSTATRTLALVGGVMALSATSKSALAAAAGPLAHFGATEALGHGAAIGTGATAGFLAKLLGATAAAAKASVPVKIGIAAVALAVVGAGSTVVYTQHKQLEAKRAAAARTLTAHALEGYWLGSLPRGQGTMRIGFQLRTEADGTITGVLDDPDSRVLGIPISAIEVNGVSVRFRVDLLDGVFEGNLRNASSLSGSWSQYGNTFPLSLARTDQIPERRPNKERVETQLPPAVLDQYVGQYALGPKFSIIVTREGDHLIQQASRQPPTRLRAETENRFFLAEADAELTFFKDPQGRVQSLILVQNGVTLGGRKIK